MKVYSISLIILVSDLIEVGRKILLVLRKEVVSAKHNISNRNMERQIISINQPHVKKIAFINLYRPPQGNVTMFCDMLHDTIVSLNASTTHEIEIFVLGDFNINYTNSTSPGYKDIKWFEQRVGFQQLINASTRYAHTNTYRFDTFI